MNKQEQIEKLASLMADCNTTCDKCFEKLESVMTLPIQKRENYCQVYAYAQRAVEQGYQKLPKDSVVLTKEEYEMLANQYKNLEIKYSNLSDNYRLCKDANEVLKHNVVTTRKETAKEILNSINEYNLDYNWDLKEEFKKLCKDYGVEVEDD